MSKSSLGSWSSWCGSSTTNSTTTIRQSGAMVIGKSCIYRTLSLTKIFSIHQPTVRMAYKKVTTTSSLPPLPKLRVRRPVLNKSTNQCLVIMTSLLNCWAANGDGASTCLNFEKDLKNCMETYKPEKEQLSTINYHASRLYPKFKGTVTD